MSETKSSQRASSLPPLSRGSSNTLTASSSPTQPVSHTVEDDVTVISTRPPLSDVPQAALLPPLQVGKILEGEQLGQFLLQSFVGGGGMGAVFRALDTTLNREVAVKVLSPNQSSDEELLRRFQNEAQSAARLDHDNIARVYYVGQDRGVHYIVFEFIEGVNIRDLVERQGPLPLAEAISYTLQVAEALTHASQRDVIHRDIKPSNVLITPDGKAKLVDMGLARLHQVEHTNNDLTASGVTLGTFDYISPEQARDPRSADVRSDLYSLGCSLFYMLTGRPPFPEGTVLQKLLQHQENEPPDIRTLRPGLPAEIPQILGKLLAKNPADRYQQPSELIAELAGLGEQLGLLPSNAAATRTVEPRADTAIAWQRHLPWAVPLTALVLIVAALDYFWSQGATASGRRAQNDSKADITKFAPRVKASADKRDDIGKTPVDASIQTHAPTEVATKRPVPDGENRAAESPDPAARGVTPAQLPQFPWDDPRALKNLATAIVEAIRSNVPKVTLPANPNGEPAAVATTPPAESHDGLLIVSDSDEGENAYTNLQAACAAAKSGETIELRFNGRREQRPISLANTNLTIRAGEHFKPIVVFRPLPADLAKTRSMVTLIGGQMKLINVPIELDITREMRTETWTLFEMRHADLVRLDRCSLTFKSGTATQKNQDSGASFFDVRAAPGADAMSMMNPVGMEEHVVAIDLSDCIARGEATLLRANELQSVRFSWNNGLLATSERLLSVAGGATLPRQAGHVQIDLVHVTAAVHGGLAQLANSEEAPYQLTTEIKCSDSILVGPASAAVIQQKGIDSVEAFRKRLQWTGQRNVYEGFDAFWAIVNPAASAEPVQLDFDEWEKLAGGSSETRPLHDVIGWKDVPAARSALHNHTPDDYLLPDSLATEDMDAGCRFDQLPALPTQAAQPSSAEATHPLSLRGED